MVYQSVGVESEGLEFVGDVSLHNNGSGELCLARTGGVAFL